jgi:uncharacterized protein (TIGR02271 family)
VTITVETIQQYIGKNLFDDGGNKIGKIGAVFLDDATGQPEWLTVSTGFFGTNESFVPVADASTRDDGLTVPYSKDKVKDAPNVDVDRGHLSSDEEAHLYRYYGLEYSTSASDTNLPAGSAGTGRSRSESDRSETGTSASPAYATTERTVDGGDGTAYDDTSTTDADRSNVGRTDLIQQDEDYDGDPSTGMSAGPSGPDAGRSSSDLGGDAMTRSEERLNVGTEQVTTGKARLRKWVETEHQQVEVPVRKEKVRLETEPVTKDNLGEAYSGPDITEDEHEVTLTEERPVVETEAVPVERVRVTKDVEEQTQTVGGEVRKERVGLDSDQDVDRR